MTSTQSLVGLKPLRNKVLVYIYDDGNTSITLADGKKLVTGLTDTEFNGIYKDQVDGKHPGIRARWAMVIGINDDTPTDLKVGDKVFLEQMKWRRGIYVTKDRRVWDIEFDDILVVDDNGFDDEEVITVTDYLAGFETEE